MISFLSRRTSDQAPAHEGDRDANANASAPMAMLAPAAPTAPAIPEPPVSVASSEETSSRDLVRAAAAGDARATKVLLKRLSPRVARSVRLVMGGAHPDFDDAVQLSLIALIQALPAFRGECEPEHYAGRIAVRTAMAARRRSTRRNQREDGSVAMETMVSEDRMPEGEMAMVQTRSIVRELLDKLPEEQAETLALRVALGWSLDEVAKATGAPLNTVRSRLRLAKEAMRRRIEADAELVLALAPAMSQALGSVDTAEVE